MKICLKLGLRRRPFLRFWAGLIAGIIGRIRLPASNENAKPCYFNVPEGDSVKTLRLAARQAKVEILISADVLDGVRTRKIRGTFTPIEAFNFMLEETALRVVRHQESGVYAIKLNRKSKMDPNKPEDQSTERSDAR